jgi:hypothetical protein
MTNKQKQHLLAFLGLYKGDIDGIWGPKSEQAIKDFEELYNRSGDDDDLLTAVYNWVPDATDNNVGSTGSFWDECPNFTREEFRCTCGGRGCNGFPAEPRERLVRNAQACRAHFGKAAHVSSGVRCQLRNSELPGSAANSLHLSGRAMDFCIQGVSANKLLAYVKTLPDVDEAYAINRRYVHMGVEKN